MLVRTEELKNKQKNITHPEPQSRKVHLIKEIGVALIESDYELTNGETNLNLGIKFSNEFFSNVGIKNECNNTGEATKAVIKAGQDFYRQLLNQLQSKIYGNKVAKVERRRDVEATSLEINEDFYQYNEYEYIQFKRLKNIVIAKSINKTTIILLENILVNPLFTDKRIVVQGKQTILILPISYVDHIKWSEYIPPNRNYTMSVAITCLKYTCTSSCDLEYIESQQTSEEYENYMHYKLTIQSDKVMCTVMVNEKQPFIMKSIEFYGIQEEIELRNVNINNSLSEVISIKAPSLMQEGLNKSHVVIFNQQNHQIICKQNTIKNYKSCIHEVNNDQINLETIPLAQSRKKRGLLELIKTGHYFASDYTKEIIHKEVDIEKQRDGLISKEIKTLSDETNHIIAIQDDEFDSLEESLCLLEEEEEIYRVENIITQKISSQFQKLTRVIEQCSFGKISLEVNLLHFKTICSMYLLSKQKCENMQPADIRELFKCKGAELKAINNDITIQLTVSIPNILIDYKALQIETIPIFYYDSGRTIIKTLILKNKKVFQTSTGYLSFDYCEKLGGITICDQNDAKNDDSLNCLRSLITNDPESAYKFCNIRTEFAKEQKCYSKSTNAGELISTTESVHHQYDLFDKTTESSGVNFIKTANLKRSFICGKKVIQPRNNKIEDVHIVNHDVQLNLSHLLESERLPYIEKETSILHKKIKANSEALTKLIGNTETKMQDTDKLLNKLNIPISKTKSVHISILIQILVFIITTLIVMIIFVFLYKKCSKCFRKCMTTQEPVTIDYDPGFIPRRRLRLDTPPQRRRSPYIRSGQNNRINETLI